jgi:hypothetical protein
MNWNWLVKLNLSIYFQKENIQEKICDGFPQITIVGGVHRIMEFNHFCFEKC